MAAGRKTGGRTAGTPNRATRQVKDFLDRVFTRVFTETRIVKRGDELVAVSYEDFLVDQILHGQIDDKLLQFLFTMYAGRPAQAVDHTHRGKVALERIIAGTASAALAEDADDEDGD